MASDYVPRASIDPSQHGLVDAELKSLKLLSRRLQSTVTILGAELQLLQRLYYKNKNQHRGALFWRNVGELLRYIRRLEDVNLQGSLITLRNTFYGSMDSSTSMKGPWTHCPSRRDLGKRSDQYQIAIKLLDKLSEVCLRAYKSFHRSLQSAAFLQILLMFVAVSSRTRSLALELQGMAQDMHSSTHKLLMSLFLQPEQGSKNDTPISTTVKSMDVDMSIESPIFTANRTFQECITPATKTPEIVYQSMVDVPVTVTPEAAVVVERRDSKKIRKEIEQSKKSSDDVSRSKKKKQKVSRDEIDDIFGF